jgi:hypothetical protein
MENVLLSLGEIAARIKDGLQYERNFGIEGKNARNEVEQEWVYKFGEWQMIIDSRTF